MVRTFLINHRKIFLGLLALVLGFLYFSLTYKDLFYAPDEGATVYHFERCFEGAIQHRDFYSVYGFGFYVIGKALFQLFGCNLLVLRVTALVLKLLIILLIYALSLSLIRPVFAFFACVGFIIWWGDPLIATPTFLYPIQLNLILGLLGILFIIFYLRGSQKGYIALSALCVGMGSLFKPNIAIFNLMAIFFFFVARELVLDVTEAGPRRVESAKLKGWLSRAWVIGQLLISILGVAMLFSFFARFGLDKVVFAFFFIPIMSMLGYVLFLGLRALRLESGPYWGHVTEAFWIFVLFGLGLLFWQVVQVLYFFHVGALQDFYSMLRSAGSYYSNYAIPLWKGGIILAVGFGLFFLLLFNQFILKVTAGSRNSLKKALFAVAALFAMFLFILWVVRLNTPRNYHIMVWYSSLLCSLYASYFIFFRQSTKQPPLMKSQSMLVLSLILFYTTTTFLDAFPKVDIGHITMIVPPFIILFGLVGQYFHDSWSEYLEPVFPKHNSRFAGGLTAAFGVLLFLPSLLMMFMFHVPIKASDVEGMHLYQGRLQLVPRYEVTMERAKGLTLHVADTYIGAPVEPPKRRDFFRVAERIEQITEKGDKLFSTSTSCLMLYFLADRDGIDGKANCYVFQTVMGVTTSKEVGDSADLQLAQLVDQRNPKVIIVEENDPETERFIANWPYTWNFITLHYKVSEQIGPYQLYTPK